MRSFGYLILFLLIINADSINGQEKEVTSDIKTISNEVVKVYYFHNARRCATCQAVEKVTKETLDEFYPEELKNGTIDFQSLNIEDDENKALAKELDITGQALLLIKDKVRKDLTNEAFLYARSNPDKLKNEILQFIGSK
jgi:hypothetical protein